jgi:hypothetical protein
MSGIAHPSDGVASIASFDVQKIANVDAKRM